MWQLFAEVWLWILVAAVVAVVLTVAVVVLWNMVGILVKDVKDGWRDPEQRAGTGCGLALAGFLVLGLFLLFMAGHCGDS